jgi:hypothetical protein
MSKYSALFSREAYNMLGSASKSKRLNKINKNISHTGFRATEESNRDILHLVNDKTGETHISVRGTDAGAKGKTKQDVLTDLKFALGKETHDKHFKKKINRINNLVKKTPKGDITLSGHSLGGGIANEAMKSKKNIRERVSHSDTYNSAFSPFTKKASKNVQKQLKDKVIHHRNKSDLVSASSAINNTVGKVKEYETKEVKKIKKIPSHLSGVFDSLDQLKAHSIDQFINEDDK